MAIIRISEPVWLAVTLDEAKEHLYAEGEDVARDKKIESALLSASAFVELNTSRTLARASYLFRVCGWSSAILIPTCPVVSVDAVEYYDADDELQPVDESSYLVQVEAESTRIVFKTDFDQPSLSSDRPEPVQISFTAGYDDPAAESTGSGDDPALKLDATLRAAILIKTEAIFEAGALDAGKLDDLNKAAQDLVELKRAFRF